MNNEGYFIEENALNDDAEEDQVEEEYDDSESESESEGNSEFEEVLLNHEGKIISFCCFKGFNVMLDRKEEITDDDSDDEWIIKKRNFHVKKYGNACVYIHKVFSVKKKTKETLFPDSMNKGKICAVVVSASNRSNYFFKIYDCEAYRHPPASEKQYSYIHCSRLMTQDLNKLPVIWEKEELYGNSLLRRRVRQHFKAGWYTGRVTLYNSRTKLYTINYDDGDSETMNLNALLQALRP